MAHGHRQAAEGSWAPEPCHCPRGLSPHAVDVGQGKRLGQGTSWAAGVPQQGEEHRLWFCVPGAAPSDRLGTKDQGPLPHLFPGCRGAAARVCRHLCSLSTTSRCPTPSPGCVHKTSLCTWGPVYGETEALGGCGRPPEPQQCCPGSPGDSQPAAGCCGLSCQQHRPPRSPHSAHSDSSLP